MRQLFVLSTIFFLLSCTHYAKKEIVATSYCNCSKCCSWGRNFPDFWNRHYTAGPNKGDIYTGLTASGTRPREPYDGLLSFDTFLHPWALPHRLLLPWFWFAHDGTIAADTKHYPFGTRMFVPGYGWGRVEDRGSAIKGVDRIDLYKGSHKRALEWGKKKVTVEVSE